MISGASSRTRRAGTRRSPRAGRSNTTTRSSRSRPRQRWARDAEAAGTFTGRPPPVGAGSCSAIARWIAAWRLAPVGWPEHRHDAVGRLVVEAGEADAREGEHDRHARVGPAQPVDQLARAVAVAARPGVVDEDVGLLGEMARAPVEDRARVGGGPAALLDVVAEAAQRLRPPGRRGRCRGGRRALGSWRAPRSAGGDGSDAGRPETCRVRAVRPARQGSKVT